MNLQLWVSCLLSFICGVLFYRLQRTRKELKQWQKLEANQARRINELMAALDLVNETQAALEKFRTTPGMETVSAAIARKILDLQADNLKITMQLNETRLQAAKYMDLYRAERYKPHRKYT